MSAAGVKYRASQSQTKKDEDDDDDDDDDGNCRSFFFFFFFFSLSLSLFLSPLLSKLFHHSAEGFSRPLSSFLTENGGKDKRKRMENLFVSSRPPPPLFWPIGRSAGLGEDPIRINKKFLLIDKIGKIFE